MRKPSKNVPYQIYRDVNTHKTVVIIKDKSIGFDKAKTIANNHFRVSLDMLKVYYAMTMPKGMAHYNENWIGERTANAYAVVIERR